MKEETAMVIEQKKWIIWGAGQIGRSICRLLLYKNCNVIAFIDLNPKLQGQKIEGVKVHGKNALSLFENYVVCVAVDGRYDEIAYILMNEYGLHRDQILNYPNFLQEALMKNIQVPHKKVTTDKSIVFLCDGGLGLGGVETWCLTFGKLLKQKGITVKYLVPCNEKENKQNLIEIECEDFCDFGNTVVFETLIQRLVECLPCTVVTNYKYLGYLAACAVKQAYPKDIRVVSVVHGGKQEIFDWNVIYQDYVDCFIGVSRYGICDKLIENGIPKDKVENVVCPVPIGKKLERAYSKAGDAVVLAYAGRLTLKDPDKRIDLLIPFIERLEKSKTNYILHIAGDGDYRQELETFIYQSHLQKKIFIHGLIPRDQMKEYWKNTDIFINISDSEGNCMSMLEALSQGCVPILTDVSGVRDSVENGYNGYIVKKRDIDAMVKHIFYLDEHRELIKVFGKRSWEKMRETYCDEKMTKKFLKILTGHPNIPLDRGVSEKGG